jgi:biopolymer transport protein ExbB/TolQ
MSDTVIQALITGGAVVLTGVITGIITGGKVVYRIDQLEKKVEKHNNLVERVAKVEESAKSAHHRIDELKGEAAHV